MKKLCTPWATLARTSRSTSSALRARDLRPWTLMIVQKLQRKGHPRPASKLVRTPHRAANDVHREIRHRRALQVREVVHEVVQRLELAAIGGAQQLVEPPLGLAGEERDTEIHRLLQLGRELRQHRDAAANVKPADADWNARGAERPRNVDGPRKLVALHADQGDQPTSVRFADLPDDAVGPDPRVGLVPGGDPDLDVFAQHPPLSAVERKAVHRRQGIGRNRRASPLDDVAVVVVVGGLDQEQVEKPCRFWLGCDLHGELSPRRKVRLRSLFE